MEVYAQGTKFITKIINKHQKNKISTSNLNKKILINAIFTYYYLSKKSKNYKKIKEEQNNIFQSFFELEWLQDKRERDLISTIRDRKSRVIVENSIKSYRENMLTNLSQKKKCKTFSRSYF